MTSPPTDPAITVVLLDIEGTTTPVDFVYRVLFPHAAERLEAYLASHDETTDLQMDLDNLEAEHANDPDVDRPPWDDADRVYSALLYLRHLMAADRKSTALKSIQGKIWREGYERGAIRGQLFPDVAEAMRRWHAAGRRLYIFSSGSVLAQKLLFAHSEAGDLTPLLAGYFDTTTGPKREASSYRRIASAIGQPTGRVLFISDVGEELDAAAAAGMQTAQTLRPGNTAPASPNHRTIRDFGEV